ncbi:hypothetical protein GX917_00125 [Candidatus Falkowbacteria bacterium]|jgi:uncharacterized protein YpmB|nr:hypothetical protein [Candidatus Falkowbacteria bacterium]
MNKKKTTTIIVSLSIILLLIILAIIFLPDKNKAKKNGELEYATDFIPEMLSTTEKQEMGIPAETQIQVMSRDESGEVTVYKIIRDESDIVNPAKVEPLIPQNLEETSQ